MIDIHLFNSYTAQIDECCKASKAISIIRVHLRFIYFVLDGRVQAEDGEWARDSCSSEALPPRLS